MHGTCRRGPGPDTAASATTAIVFPTPRQMRAVYPLRHHVGVHRVLQADVAPAPTRSSAWALEPSDIGGGRRKLAGGPSSSASSNIGHRPTGLQRREDRFTYPAPQPLGQAGLANGRPGPTSPPRRAYLRVDRRPAPARRHAQFGEQDHVAYLQVRGPTDRNSPGSRPRRLRDLKKVTRSATARTPGKLNPYQPSPCTTTRRSAASLLPPSTTGIRLRPNGFG